MGSSLLRGASQKTLRASRKAKRVRPLHSDPARPLIITASSHPLPAHPSLSPSPPLPSSHHSSFAPAPFTARSLQRSRRTLWLKARTSRCAEDPLAVFRDHSRAETCSGGSCTPPATASPTQDTRTRASRPASSSFSPLCSPAWPASSAAAVLLLLPLVNVKPILDKCQPRVSRLLPLPV